MLAVEAESGVAITSPAPQGRPAVRVIPRPQGSRVGPDRGKRDPESSSTLHPPMQHSGRRKVCCGGKSRQGRKLWEASGRAECAADSGWKKAAKAPPHSERAIKCMLRREGKNEQVRVPKSGAGRLQ